jgi:hypothetical protein
VTWRLVIVALACLGGLASAAPQVEQATQDLGFGSDVAARLRQGEIVVDRPQPSSPRELAVGISFLIDKSVADLSADYRAAIDLRADGQLRAVGVVRGAADDFASVTLSADEAARWLAAAPGDDFNLSADEIAAFHAAAASGGDARASAERQLRRMLSDRRPHRRAGGLDAVAPYARAGGAVRKPSDELLTAATAATLLPRYAPALAQLLRTYPQGKPPGFVERFFVLTYDLDGRPNYVLRHRMEVPLAAGVAVVDRDFYVSRGYNTSQATSGLIAVDAGTLVFYRDRVSTDQLTGFASSVKQALGERVMAQQLTAIFQRSRNCFERPEACPGPDLGLTAD